MMSSCGGTIGSRADRGPVPDETTEDAHQGSSSLGAAAKRLSSTWVGDLGNLGGGSSG